MKYPRTKRKRYRKGLGVDQFKKVKVRSYQSARNRTWDMFSLFIRLRDCLKTTGNKNLGKCITCGKIYQFKDLQAGHLVQGRGNAVLFDELGVNAQCERCNIYNDGEALIYRAKLIELHGEGIVRTLESKRFKTKRYSIPELDCLYHYYKQEYKKLCASTSK